MSDITPKAIATPSGVTPVIASSATAATSNTATAAEIPASVANLNIGTVVSGTVIERSPRGLTVLRTDKGTIKLQTPVPLKLGSTVSLQIQSVGSQVQLLILSIDGQPLANASGKNLSPRQDGMTKSPSGDTLVSRAQPTTANAVSPPGTTQDEADAAAARLTPSDRLAADRNPSGQARGRAAAPPAAPAGGFIARPLAQINSLSLEALSSPPTPTPATATANPIVRTTPPLEAAPSATPAANRPPAGATMAGVSSLPEGMSSPPIIAPGIRFTATLLSGAPVEPTVMAEGKDSATPQTQLSGALPRPPNSAATNLAAPPALPSDRVILRLLGIATAQGPTPMATAAAVPAATPQITTGLSIAADARTMIGTIVEETDGAHVPYATRAATNTNSATTPAATAKTLIATPFGLLSAAGPAPGPVGSKLLLELIALGEPLDPRQPLSGAAGKPMVASPNSADKSWPTLRSLMTAMQSVAPGAAEHLSNVTLPQIGPNLTVGMMVFIGALRQGNPRAWLGEQASEILQRTGHGPLIDRLGDEMTTATRLAAETNPQGWQSLLMPLYDGSQLQQIRMYWQRQPRKANQSKDGTRFVIEAELTSLGLLQLDGVFNKPQFDLVVRTSTSMPAAMRSDIIEIYGDALLATSLKGAVSFQTSADLRAGPPDNPDEAGGGLIV